MTVSLPAHCAGPAHTYCPKPVHAWGMKSIFQPEAIELIGPHRPKSVRGDWNALGWVNGAGKPMPERYYDANWRMDKDTASYDLAQINHYAVRTRESFLVKCLRGRAHHSYSYDAEYWERMNRNEKLDETIQPMLPAAHAIFEELMEDPILGDLHGEAVEWHQETIAKTLATPEGASFDAGDPIADVWQGRVSAKPHMVELNDPGAMDKEAWNAELRALGEAQGFFEELGEDHTALFVKSGKTLIVTFENLDHVFEHSQPPAMGVRFRSEARLVDPRTYGP